MLDIVVNKIQLQGNRYVSGPTFVKRRKVYKGS